MTFNSDSKTNLVGTWCHFHGLYSQLQQNPSGQSEQQSRCWFRSVSLKTFYYLRECTHENRFESRDICEEIIKKFHGQPIGEEGLLLQVRYADTPAQKDLKRVTTERRQFRTNEYNVGAYGAPVELLSMPPPMPSPLGVRTSQVSQHVPTKLNGPWKRDGSGR